MVNSLFIMPKNKYRSPSRSRSSKRRRRSRDRSRERAREVRRSRSPRRAPSEESPSSHPPAQDKIAEALWKIFDFMEKQSVPGSSASLHPAQATRFPQESRHDDASPVEVFSTDE
ncbi:uncharacterized protein LOC112588828 [Harpegnathos saltator]|uniref:uncharacterized protein LOC112588828 n=1 Tax=Harpegnathos saltator TaxID=610380 RepID=UPI000DBED9AA|nr:uncharacterized protein LOC112588828 [Harpegnathos saltator]